MIHPAWYAYGWKCIMGGRTSVMVRFRRRRGIYIVKLAFTVASLIVDIVCLSCARKRGIRFTGNGSSSSKGWQRYFQICRACHHEVLALASSFEPPPHVNGGRFSDTFVRCRPQAAFPRFSSWRTFDGGI